MDVPGIEQTQRIPPASAAGARPGETLETAYLRDAFAGIPPLQSQFSLESSEPLEPQLLPQLSDEEKAQIAYHASTFLAAQGDRPGTPLYKLIARGTFGDAQQRERNKASAHVFVESAIGSLAAITQVRSRNLYWKEGDAESLPDLFGLPRNVQHRIVGMTGSMALHFLQVASDHNSNFLAQNHGSMPHPSLSIFQGPVSGLIKALQIRPDNLDADAVIKAFARNGVLFRDPESTMLMLTGTNNNNLTQGAGATSEKTQVNRQRKLATFKREFDELRDDPELSAANEVIGLLPGQTVLLHRDKLGVDLMARLIAKYTRLVGYDLYTRQSKKDGPLPVPMDKFPRAHARLFPRGMAGISSALCLSVLEVDEASLSSEVRWDPERMSLENIRRLVFSFGRTQHGGTRDIQVRELFVILSETNFMGAPHTRIRRAMGSSGNPQGREALVNTVIPLRDAIILP